jgi:hypothetical protein
MNYDESTVERLCSANNFCGMPMWLKYQNYLFSTVEEKLESYSGCWRKKILFETHTGLNGGLKDGP